MFAFGSKLPAPRSMLLSRKLLWLGAVLLAATVLAGFAHVPILREVASFLITEDSLEPAAAIVRRLGRPSAFS
jgi:hypothetical protein